MAETGKMYLQLFHGRRDPKESLDDWGEQGPIFGPLQYVHTTYIYDIKIEDIKGKDGVLKIYDDMVYYDGMYYGDWSAFILIESTQDIAERHQEFDQGKANLPQATESWPGGTVPGTDVPAFNHPNVAHVEESNRKVVTLTIDRNDLGQIIDGLTARAELYDETERHFNGEVILGEIAECNDAEEAHAIAEHYRKIIAQLEAAR